MKEETKEKLQTLISQAIDENITAGMNMLVRKDNEEIFYTEHGFRNLEKGKKIQRNTIFRLYSMSKPITAAADQEKLAYHAIMCKMEPCMRARIAQRA